MGIRYAYHTEQKKKEKEIMYAMLFWNWILMIQLYNRDWVHLSFVASWMGFVPLFLFPLFCFGALYTNLVFLAL